MTRYKHEEALRRHLFEQMSQTFANARGPERGHIAYPNGKGERQLLIDGKTGEPVLVGQVEGLRILKAMERFDDIKVVR